MRAVECPCGEYLEARNDHELLDAAKSHASQVHDGQYSESDIKILVDTAAYDVGSSGPTE